LASAAATSVARLLLLLLLLLVEGRARLVRFVKRETVR